MNTGVHVFVTRDTRESPLERCCDHFFSSLFVFILQSAQILIDFAIPNADIFDKRARDRYGDI